MFVPKQILVTFFFIGIISIKTVCMYLTIWECDERLKAIAVSNDPVMYCKIKINF